MIFCRSIDVRINRSSIGYALLTLLCFFTLLFPRDNYNIKKILLLLFFLYNIGTIISSYKKDVYAILITIFIPMIMVVISVLKNGSLYYSLTQVYFYAYFSVAYVVYKYKYNLNQIILGIGNLIALIILLSVFLDVTYIIPYYSNPILNFFSSMYEAQISVSPYAIAYYVFFFKGSPILLYNLIFYLKEKKYIKAAEIFLSLLFTGTRANIGMAAFIVVIYILLVERNNIIRLISAIAIIATSFLFSDSIITRVAAINRVKASGDSIRLDTIRAIFDSFKNDPLQLVIGAGFGSTYSLNNAKRAGVVITSEMSYLEMFRQYGIILGFMIVLFIFSPIRRLYSCNKAMFWFYICYLVEGFFEPFIFTSTGFLVIAFAYSEVFLAYDRPLVFYSSKKTHIVRGEGKRLIFD